MKCIAVDFGGYAIKIALISSGHIETRTSIPAYSSDGLSPRLPFVKEAVMELLAGEDLKSFAGVAVSMPGIVDPVRKVVTGIYGKYEDSRALNLEAWCQEAFGLPLIMEMDSKLALLGEMEYGCARGYDDAVMMILGTGVGTAVALNGQLLQSRNYTAGALSSHIIIDMNGRKCTCPNAGCLEAMASGWALEGLVKEHKDYADSLLSDGREITFKSLSDCCKAGDRTALDVYADCVRAWRTGILNLIHAYSPQIVVISGGIIQFDGLFEDLTSNIQSHVWDCCGTIEIRRPEHPEDSIMYGLAGLAEKTWGLFA